MGRRVYWQAVILIVMTLRQARVNGIGANQLMRKFAIPRKTIGRWISYFRHEFAASREWLRLRGRICHRRLKTDPFNAANQTHAKLPYLDN